MNNQFDNILNIEIPEISEQPVTASTRDNRQKWGNLEVWELDLRAFFDLPDKEEYRESYSQWGKYGWTIISAAPVKLFHTAPKSQEEADATAMKYLTDDDIDGFLQKLLERSSHNKPIEEAVQCFQHGLYRGCAMIVTSELEREMNALQDNKKRSGKGAVAYTCKRMRNSESTQKYNTPKCYVRNLSAYLDELIASTSKRFASEDIYTNIKRNYLMHGRHDLPVTKIDSLKMLNAMDNWLYIKESFGI